MKQLLIDLLRYFVGNYQKIFIRLLLIYVLLYPIVAVYSILGVWGHKRYLNKKELGAGPLVNEKSSRNNYADEEFNWRYSLGSWGFVETPIRFEKPVFEAEKSEKLIMKESEIEDIISAARDISSDLLVDLDDRPLLYVTIINDAFEEMTMNWLCNVQPFETILDRTLIIAGSKRVCERIMSEYNEVTCVPVTLPHSLNRDFEERPEHRREFTAYRLRIMEKLAAQGLNVLYFETDSLWLKDPSDLFRNATGNGRVDITAGSAGEDEEIPYSFDPLLVLANNQTTSFLTEARRLFEAGMEESELKDVINNLCTDKFNDINCDRFKWNNVADGMWFEYGPRQRSKYNPYIVSNNLQPDIVDKIARQQINKMWLLKKEKCDAGLRKKFFTEYGDKEITSKLTYTKEKEAEGMWKRVFDRAQKFWSDLRWNLGKALKFIHVF